MRRARPTALGGAGGHHLTPSEFHNAVLRCNRSAAGAGGAGPTRPQILIDTRNHYETAVGTFKGAVDPKIRCFAQFPGWISANKERLKDADVYMFCTGGIRCEKASSHLRALGAATSTSFLARFSSRITSSLPPCTRRMMCSTWRRWWPGCCAHS